VLAFYYDLMYNRYYIMEVYTYGDSKA
jgi:hypothetical protein